MAKYGFDYFVKRCEVLSEMAAPVRNPLLLTITSGESGDKFKEIFKEITKRITTGKTSDGEQLVDKNGEPAPGISAAPDDRKWKWTLKNLIEVDDETRIDVTKIDPSEIAGLYNSVLGDHPKFQDPIGGEQYFDRYLRKIDSSILGFARLVLVRTSIKDGVNYLADGGGGLIRGAKLMKAATALIVKNNPNILKSPEFLDNVMDSTQIASFMNDPTMGRVNEANAYSSKVAKSKLDIMGVDHGDNSEGLSTKIRSVEELISQAKLIVNKVKQAHGYVKAKATAKKRKDGVGDDTKSSENTVKKVDPEKMINKYTQNVPELTGVMKWVKAYSQVIKNGYLDYKEKFPKLESDEVFQRISDEYDLDPRTAKIFYFASMGTIQSLVDMVSKLGDVGLSGEKFLNVLNLIRKNYSNDVGVTEALDLIEQYSLIVQKIKEEEEGSETLFDFDDAILDAILTNPDDRDLFTRWHTEVYKPFKMNKFKRELLVLNGDIAANITAEQESFDQYFNATTNKLGDTVDRNKELDYAQLKKDLKAKPREKWSEVDLINAKKLGISTDDGNVSASDEAEAFKYLQANSGFKRQSESYVMDYMTEQVSKDRFTPNGEFKERGFKKTVNYSQWMDINE